jgi:spermidine/putrescine transport system ATP-binding protein
MSTDPTLRCEDLKMRYPDTALWALGSDDAGVSLEVAEGELFALLGPSGCGKTTTLRIVGGFVHPTSGTVEIGGVDVTGSPAHSRPTNTVFQNYALFPHKTIAENVAFGLRIKRTPKPERERRVAEALEMVGLTDYARRKVSELSGGQAQRAALARAIVNRPSVLLLDEPLGALDLKLRRQMQDELVRIKGETNISFVHVTHDQEEAMTMADTIAVMNAGRIEQLGSPEELYENPATTFVANFLGQSNLVAGTIADTHGDVVSAQAHGERITLPRARCRAESGAVILGVRPEKVALVHGREEAPDEHNVLPGGIVTDASFIGVSTQYLVKMPWGQELSVFEQNIGKEIFRPGTEVALHWDASQTFGLDGSQDIEAGAEIDEEAAK